MDYDQIAQQYGATDAGTKGDKYDQLAAQFSAPTPQKPKGFLEKVGDVAGKVWEADKRGVQNIVGGAANFLGKYGSTLLYPVDAATDAIMGDRGPNISGLISGQQPKSRHQERVDSINDFVKNEVGADESSLLYKGADLAGNVAASGGVGGLIKKGAIKYAPALAGTPTASKLLAAIESGGFKTGAPIASTITGKAADIGIRSAGGAINGAASAALIDPAHMDRGAIIGGLIPGGATLAGATGSYLGRAAKSLVQPLTKTGQENIAGNIISRFGEGGPMAINANEIVPGSMPTLAEATGNAGIAGLQRTARDLRPNAFQAREAQNASALTTKFDDIAGDAGQLEFFKTQRDQAAKELYGKALDRIPEPVTPWLKGEINQLLKRPSIDDASRTAQKWAIERGEKPAMDGSLRALHDVKVALDDKIAGAVQAGQGGEVKALKATQGKLLTVMEKLSPDYAEARATYAAMSKPINEMEALQGLKVTDKVGNITLAKIQNAIKGLQNQRLQAGFNNAKSVDEEKLKTLMSIRDDLLRKESNNAGKSAGSNTFQNIATDNILGTMLPGKLGGLVSGRVGDVVGQVGKLAYSGANEKIRNNMLDMMLDPALAQTILKRQQALGGSSKLAGLLDSSAPMLYRSAPALSNDR